jgi:CRISPR/Cas system-associated exonuclease Cas4 (RecB family)
MSLRADFLFSQATLQDYVDCPRRFQLRYLEQVAWPTPLAVPILENERRMQRGADFHRLLHQQFLGLPAELLRASLSDPALIGWWEAYQQTPPADLPPHRCAEFSLSAALGGYRLAAKYDLIAAAPGERIVIVDYKTNERRPTRRALEGRLQTRVYRYLLAAAGERFNEGKKIAPEQVEMLYWFATFPAQPERFRYSATLYEGDGRYLSGLIAEIAARADDWPQTAEARACRFCHYFSYCERGKAPGNLSELDDAPEEEAASLDIALEQVAEVEF